MKTRDNKQFKPADIPLPRAAMALAFVLYLILAGAAGLLRAAQLSAVPSAGKLGLSIGGDPDNEWRLETSTDLSTWTGVTSAGTILGDTPGTSLDAPASGNRFYRAVRTDGLFDPEVIRTVRLTFAESGWQSLLVARKSSGSNLLGNLELEGTTYPGVGVRYKGNTSYTQSGAKKSLNIEIGYTNATSRVRGYKTLNLNNAAGDESLLREVLYFRVMSRYTPCPKAGFARLYINGEYWGLYSLVQQEDGELIDEWFPSNDGDRWRAPNIGGGTGGGPGGPGGPGGGGGGFASGTSALLTLSGGLTAYKAAYELKSDDTTEAWDRLVNAIDVLNTTSDTEFPTRIHEVLNVDRWLWFLALENIFADDDSYFNKGADYMFYYEPESGQIHPVEHDGNESFTAGDVQLSPVIGTGNANRPVINRLLAVPEFRQRYLAHMRTVLEESYNPAVYLPVADHFATLTVSSLNEDPKKSYTMAAYTSDVAALKTFIQQRYNYLTSHAEVSPVGPAIVDTQDPSPLPTPADVPFVTAVVKAHGSDGLDSVWLYFRGTSYGSFTRVPMFDDGAHGDGKAGDGTFGAATAAFPAGTKVRYYVEARSGNAAHTAVFSPARAEQDTHSYRVLAPVAPATSVVINELMADNTRTLADPQGEFDDWIELRNTGAAAVDLTGMYLTDEPTNPRKWAFPAGTTLPAGGYLVVWADEDGAAPLGLHASFKLAGKGEQVLLIDTDEKQNAILDSVIFGELAADQAYGRPAADPKIFAVLVPTPGAANP